MSRRPVSTAVFEGLSLVSFTLFLFQTQAGIIGTKVFSRAGLEFGLPQPSVSRTIRELERDVGTTLLTRTTRKVVLTEVGAEYLARVEPILNALEEANHLARIAWAAGNVGVLPRAPRILAEPGPLVLLRLRDPRQSASARSFRHFW